jgi:hypothetical protein
MYWVLLGIKDMGLLDITTESDQTIITPNLITRRDCLGFESMYTTRSSHFRKEIYIKSDDDLVLHCTALILAKNRWDNDSEVLVRIIFNDGCFYNTLTQRWEDIYASDIPRYEMSIKTNLYETIRLFISEDNIIRFLVQHHKYGIVRRNTTEHTTHIS